MGLLTGLRIRCTTLFEPEATFLNWEIENTRILT
jgi:hypothetical protein